jgi:hypothetical protein
MAYRNFKLKMPPVEEISYLALIVCSSEAPPLLSPERMSRSRRLHVTSDQSHAP